MNYKKVMLLISIILILSGLILNFTMENDSSSSEEITSYRNELSVSEKQLLVMKTYYNTAWGYMYKGEAIFDDGTVYSWDFEEDPKIDINNISKISELIKNKGTKRTRKVTEQDLKIIENDINKITDTLTLENFEYDAGIESISIWKNKTKIDISISGDLSLENSSNESKELIKIALKYLA